MKKKWTQYLQIAAWLTAILLTFIIPIPFTEYNQSLVRTLPVFKNVDTSFAKFIAASIIILSVIPLNRYSKKQHYIFWYFAAIIILALSVGSYFRYSFLQEEHIIRYPEGDSTIIITGSRINQDVQSKIDEIQKAEHRRLSIPEILEFKAGNAGEIWDQRDINNNRRSILLWFYVTIALFTLFVLISYHSCVCYFQKD